ncbi:MAG: hypothetical protein B7C24_05750 [Bacteroidetes bacterium 4572_77]|nr:MAG: hypothetical protein B7C24_05750 [Bacteroidetes bacterium 4572_77]
MKNVIYLLVALVVTSCASTQTKTYWVNSSKANGIKDSAAYFQVQEAEQIQTNQWQEFPYAIDGFEYKAGYFYKIEVKEEKKVADVPSAKYSLVKVLEKKEDLILHISSNWKLQQIASKKILIEDFEDPHQIPQLEIDASLLKIFGSDGCNRFFGRLIHLTESEISFGPIGGTKMMCIDRWLPDLFLKEITQVKSYKIEGSQLFFYNENKEEVMIFKRID